MCRAVLWRLVVNASALLVPLLATPISVTSIARAESAEPSGPSAAPTPQSCQEQFLLDRKENAQLALQRLRQCNATYNASVNIEEFTFWYVTLPLKPASRQTAWFGNVWRNNLQILTAAPVGIPKQDAIGVLDAGIARGLKRAKREDLGAKWLANHDPAVIAEAISPVVSTQSQHEHPQQSNTRTAQPPQAGQPASEKMLANSPQIASAAVPPTYRAPPPARRVRTRSQTRYAGPNSFRADWYDSPQHDPLIDELNRAQLQDRPQYGTSEALYRASPPQPYVASGGQPASSFASVTAQRPAPPAGFQQQRAFTAASAQQPTYTTAQPQAAYAASSQPAAYLPLPLQIEANVRSVLQQFAINVDTVERAISRQLRGY